MDQHLEWPLIFKAGDVVPMPCCYWVIISTEWPISLE
jgi:hypothetical protein